MAATEHGYMLIADITGYTMYLSQSELEHAQAVLAALLGVLIAHTKPPLVISRLAGDAVISYGLREGFYTGQTFIELIETNYVAFRKAIELVVLNNTCRCNACANIANLDLKFFVHYATFAIQRLNKQDELVGSDVNLIHRLLKNHVVEQTRVRAYTLYTGVAIQQLGLEDVCASMTAHSETYEHLGAVALWVQDMHPIWEQKRQAARITIPPKKINLQVAAEIALPPERVWDYLIQPEYRKALAGVERHDVIQRTHGRIGPGSVYQCYHGDHIIPQTVLEWQPFEQIVTQDLMPVEQPNVYVLIVYRLEPTATGTRLSQVFSKATGSRLGRKNCDQMLRGMAEQAQKDMDAFKTLIEADFAARPFEPPAAASISAALIGEAAAASARGEVD